MKKYVLIFVCAVAALAAFAQEGAGLLAHYAARMAEVKTLQSDFAEEKHLALLSEPLKSQGRLAFDKTTRQLRWQYQTPFENGFLITQTGVFRLQGDKKEAVKNAMGRMMAAQMLVWLTLDFNSLQKDYQIMLNGQEITFVPRSQQNKAVKQITVLVDDKNPQLVRQVTLQEPGGDFVVWKFSNTRLNQPLPQGALL